jgi:hypothetical protein
MLIKGNTINTSTPLNVYIHSLRSIIPSLLTSTKSKRSLIIAKLGIGCDESLLNDIINLLN